jgi:hypothetical protein
MDVRLSMITEIEELYARINNIERQKNEEVLTLLEILANLTFFGELKKARCEYVKNEQCGYFILLNEAKCKIPIAANCRIKKCKEAAPHCHLELSNITCALCEIGKDQLIKSNPHSGKKIRIHNYEKTNR